MDNLGGILGIAVAIALGAYYRNNWPNATRSFRFMQVVTVIIAAGVAGAIGSFGGQWFRYYTGTSTSTDIDKAMQLVREFPLMGQVLSENKAAEQKMRAGMEAYLKSPEKDEHAMGKLGAEIRKEYAIPMLAKADDLSALTAVARVGEFLAHLQSTDVERCYKFDTEGVGNVFKLGTEAQALYKQAMTAQEDAYRSGKKSIRTYEPTTDERFGKLLQAAGFTSKDFLALQKYSSLSPAEGCALTLKMYRAPMRLSVPDGGEIARTILTSTQ
jgi:hypothetical protein